MCEMCSNIVFYVILAISESSLVSNYYCNKNVSDGPSSIWSTLVGFFKQGSTFWFQGGWEGGVGEGLGRGWGRVGGRVGEGLGRGLGSGLGSGLELLYFRNPV